MRIISSDEKIIPITELRRRFGAIEEKLPYIDYIILTRRGKPFARLTAAPSVKKKAMKKTAGALRGTALDNDHIWKEVFKRKSRKKLVSL